MELTEGRIQGFLNSKYAGNCKYKVPNVYVFKHDWESDFFVLKHNGYSYEFEIKISRSDFFADFKKESKHSILKDGFYTVNQGKKEHKFRPNKFIYVVPKGLVSLEEVPEYCGLIYATPYSLDTVKNAPFLHKNKLEFEYKLCNKFYNYWISEMIENKHLKNEIERLKQK